jgi:hypothetical protein
MNRLLRALYESLALLALGVKDSVDLLLVFAMAWLIYTRPVPDFGRNALNVRTLQYGFSCGGDSHPRARCAYRQRPSSFFYVPSDGTRDKRAQSYGDSMLAAHHFVQRDLLGWLSGIPGLRFWPTG